MSNIDTLQNKKSTPLVEKPSLVQYVMTASGETELIIRAMVDVLIEKGDKWTTPITWDEIAEQLKDKTHDGLDWLRVMAFGRNAPRPAADFWPMDRYPGSQASDDTGWYLILPEWLDARQITESNYRQVQFTFSEKARKALYE